MKTHANLNDLPAGTAKGLKVRTTNRPAVQLRANGTIVLIPRLCPGVHRQPEETQFVLLFVQKAETVSLVATMFG